MGYEWFFDLRIENGFRRAFGHLSLSDKRKNTLNMLYINTISLPELQAMAEMDRSRTKYENVTRMSSHQRALKLPVVISDSKRGLLPNGSVDHVLANESCRATHCAAYFLSAIC